MGDKEHVVYTHNGVLLGHDKERNLATRDDHPQCRKSEKQISHDMTYMLKKEFIGPGLHLRPVHADHAQPPFQWTLNSVFSAYENNNRRIRPPPDTGTLKIVCRLLTA